MAKKKRSKNDLAAKISEKLRVTEGFELSKLATDATPGFKGKKADAEKVMADQRAEIDDLQERLYANGRDGDGPSILLVVQGMDTSGKGGIMRHVVGSVDPQGISLHAFKAPTAEEKRRPFLWRIRQQLPKPGMIGVFDRSHYEDVLIVRVHNLVPPTTWRRRYGQINAFEQSVTDAGTHVVKVMLHISSDEQRARLSERLARPDKYWKYNPGDVTEREFWDGYLEAYQAVLDRTSTDEAPWYVVPADRKWYARLAVQQILLNELRSLQLDWPPADFDVKAEQKRVAAT
ncbi:polyphosphate kinase 2 family protein [Calidifontibacter sp. DB0510]|uniref:Polyphosphate kinase 2 family protein n=1 Tax=Metallococcus carri TaxID=1656884 RepID=A0A967B267_9MICO|nr:polyphosphate kinase 2 family protein [Metallococcus carri]NHN56933.1 polyphosphate kinase 2 family protein [Metallococcus carri]NOP37678.1 polyphosphate kinase 2 family protein [Calidifontibacter sp. DB2511S]